MISKTPRLLTENGDSQPPKNNIAVNADNGLLNCSAKNVMVKATQDLDLNAGRNVNITAGSGRVHLKGNTCSASGKRGNLIHKSFGLAMFAGSYVPNNILQAAFGADASVPILGKGIYKGSRAAGIGKQGSRVINYVSKLPTVAAQGSIADAIMQSSEIGNIANLVNEHVPWVPFSEALAVDPEKDSAWISRMKSVTAGAGMNLLGHFLGTTVRMTWKAHKAVRKGMPIDEANAKFSKEGQQTMDVSTAKDVVAFDGMKKLSEQDKRGMLGRDFRREYNEKYLSSEKPEPPSLEEFQAMRESGIPAEKIDMGDGISDIEEYLRIRDGGMPSESTLRRLEDLHPSMDLGLMSDAAIREQALLDFDNLANRIGQRKGDKWNDEIAKYTCDCYFNEFSKSTSHQKAISKCKSETQKEFNL